MNNFPLLLILKPKPREHKEVVTKLRPATLSQVQAEVLLAQHPLIVSCRLVNRELGGGGAGNKTGARARPQLSDLRASDNVVNMEGTPHPGLCHHRGCD